MTVDSNVVMRQIGAKICYWRMLLGMSQSELAKRCNMSKSAIAKIERGNYNNNINMVSLIIIAEALGIEFTELITFSKYERNMWSRVAVASDDTKDKQHDDE